MRLSLSLSLKIIDGNVELHLTQPQRIQNFHSDTDFNKLEVPTLRRKFVSMIVTVSRGASAIEFFLKNINILYLTKLIC